jgi:lipopolysaccharide/colanic/teichoic acid biosynthesis glycosyltransferase
VLLHRHRKRSATFAVAARPATLVSVSKRIMDVALTLVTAPVWLALMLVTAAVLAAELRGNPFFLQQRIGLHGRPFTMVKLRTMRHPLPGEEDHYHVEDFKTFVFAPPDQPNPRITRVGAFARKTSLDELPNLFNVLRGDMSLVGPRPELPEIVAQYPPEYHRRHDVRPGIAGLAQVKGRSDLTYDETATYDLRYVDNHSVLTDLSILLRTILRVAMGSGAR